MVKMMRTRKNMNMIVRNWILVLLQVSSGFCLMTPWSKFSDCSVSCGQGIQTRSRYCLSEPCEETTRDYICTKLACPSDDTCNCGCKLTKPIGFIDSQLDIEESGTCTWEIKTAVNTRIKLNLQHIKLHQGHIHVSDHDKNYKNLRMPLLQEDSVPFTVTSQSNTLNLSIYYGYNPTNKRMKLQGNYETIQDEKPEIVKDKGKSTVNVPAIIGITACVIIIVIASFIIGYRKFVQRNDDKNEEVSEEGIEDNYSSTSSSNRSGRNKNVSPRRNRTSQTLQPKDISPVRKPDEQRLLTQRGYPDGTELYLPPTTNIVVGTQAGFITPQPYVNWPLQQAYTEAGYRQAQSMDYMMKQAQLTYTPQVIYEPTNRVGQTFHYPTSGGEG